LETKFIDNLAAAVLKASVLNSPESIYCPGEGLNHLNATCTDRGCVEGRFRISSNMFQSAPRQEPFIGIPKIQDSKTVLPGFGLPLDYAPMEQNIYGVQNRSLFPTCLDDRDIAKGDVE
jgi:hypothetical protein